MKKKPLTNKTGHVRELTRQDIKEMRPADDVLPKDLLNILPRKVGQQDGSIIAHALKPKSMRHLSTH